MRNLTVKVGTIAAFVLLVGVVCLSGLKAGAQIQFVPTINTIAGVTTSGYTGDGGPGTNAEINGSMRWIATDRQGNIYIDDYGDGVIRRVDHRTGIITTIAGGGTSPSTCSGSTNALGDGCLAVQASLGTGNRTIAIDAAGNIYTNDNTNERIRVINGATGIITTVAGGGTSNSTCKGSTNSVGDGCLATTVVFGSSLSPAVDSLGNLYIFDQNYLRVRKVVLSTGIITTVAGSGTTPGTCTGSTDSVGDGCVATQAAFANVGGLACDAAGNIYVSDFAQYRVRMINVSTGIITTIVGTGTLGTGTPVNGVPANTVPVYNPYEITFDSAQNLYLTHNSALEVREILATTPGVSPVYGNIVDVIGSGAGGTTGDGGTPSGAALASNFGTSVDPFNNISVNDGVPAVRKTDVSLPFVETSVGSSSTTKNLNAMTTAAVTLSSLGILTIYKDFTVAASSCALNTALASGKICTAPVTFTPKYPGIRTAPVTFTTSTSAQIIQGVSGYGIAPAIAFTPGTMSTLAGTGTSSNTGNGGAPASATLNGPTNSVIDSAGNIFIADTANNAIREISASTGLISSYYSTGLSGPAGLALDASGNLYIADTGNDVVREINLATGAESVVAGTAGAPGATGDGGAAISAGLSGPTGLSIDVVGNLYIADTGNNKVRVVNLVTGVITTLAGNGTAGATGDGGAATSAELHGPTGVFYVAPPAVQANGMTSAQMSGSLLIADAGNNKIRSVNLYSTFISTVAGNGTAGYLGDGAAATAAEISAPASVAADAAGDIYIADTGNLRVRRIDASTGFITTVAGNGNSCTSYATLPACGDGGVSTSASFSSPKGITLDAAANLYIADAGISVLRKVDVSHGGPLNFSAQTVGTSSTPIVLTATNTGNKALTFTGLSFANSVFTQTTSGGVDCSSSTSLAVGATCSIAIVFKPTANGPVSSSTTATNNSLNASASQMTVLTGTGVLVANGLASSVTNSTVTAGVSFSDTVTATYTSSTLTVVTVPGYTGTVHFTSSDPAAVLPADYTYSSSNAGVEIFTGIVLKTAGNQTITITDTVNPALTTSVALVVVAGAPASVTTVNGTPQNGQVSTAYPTPFEVLAKDAYGNPVSGATVTYTAPSAGPSGLFGASLTTTATTNSTGYATAGVFTANAILGSFTLNATVPGVTASAAFSLTNVASQIATTLTLQVTPVGGIVYGQAITLQAAITPATQTSSTPSKTITFFDGGTQIGAALTLPVSSITIAVPTTGTHSYTATYSGDPIFSGSSTKSPTLYTVGQSSTTVTGPSVMFPYGQAGTDNITVSGQYPGNSVSLPTGTISYQIGTGYSGTANVVSGVAAMTIPATLNVGSYAAVVTYNGDANYSVQTGYITVVIQAPTPTVTVSSSQNPSLVNSSVVLSATVSYSSGKPTGSVTFYDLYNGTTIPLGMATLTNGVASLPAITTLAVGTHSITAAYGGDGNFSQSTSQPYLQVVSTPTFTLAPSVPTLTVVQGKVSSFTLNVTPMNNFGGTLTFSCSGLPADAVCIFNTIAINNNPTLVNQLIFTGSTNNVAVPLLVSIAATGLNGTTSKVVFPGQGRGFDYASVFLLPSLILGFLLVFRRKIKKSGVYNSPFLLGAVMLMSLGCLIGCGSSLTPASPTPAGTYTVNIIASGGSPTVTQQTSIAVTVTTQ